MGYGGQTSMIYSTYGINGSASFDTGTPLDGIGQQYERNSLGDLGDTLYLKDYLLVSNIYDDRFVRAKEVGTETNVSYWLASRNVSGYRFYGRVINYNPYNVIGYEIINSELVSCSTTSGCSDTGYSSYGVRPIITLKSGGSKIERLWK